MQHNSPQKPLEARPAVLQELGGELGHVVLAWELGDCVGKVLGVSEIESRTYGICLLEIAAELDEAGVAAGYCCCAALGLVLHSW